MNERMNQSNSSSRMMMMTISPLIFHALFPLVSSIVVLVVVGRSQHQPWQRRNIWWYYYYYYYCIRYILWTTQVMKSWLHDTVQYGRCKRWCKRTMRTIAGYSRLVRLNSPYTFCTVALTKEAYCLLLLVCGEEFLT